MKPLIWLSISLGLFVLEILVPGQVLMWFGIGAATTALFRFLGLFDSVAWQLVYFAISSLCLLMIYQFWLKKKFAKPEDLSRDPTLLSAKGLVTEEIAPSKPGRVNLYQSFHGVKEWTDERTETISAGTEVYAIEADGIKLIVKPTK